MTTADSVLLTAPGTRWWPGWLLPPAMILVIVMTGVLLLMTPLWMHFALDASGVTFSVRPPETAFFISDRTVAELLFGPGTFQIITGKNFGPAIWEANEAAHLRDARLVLYVFLGLAAISLVLLFVTLRRGRADSRVWRAVARGGKVLAFGTVVLGVIGFFAFDIGFELFHRIFFPGGNWSFSPDSMLIRLYPYAFWQLTAAALGVMCIAAGGAVWLYARSRAARLEARP